MIDRRRRKGIQSIVIVFLTILVFSAIATRWINVSSNAGLIPREFESSETYKTFIAKPTCLMSCFEKLAAAQNNATSATEEACPEYFRWIHEDLSPWKETGISREMVERGKDVAHIRVVIVSGRLYVEKYKRAFQTRDVVTIWGILQLLKLYPGKLPDLDLMFECDDKPVVKKQDYAGNEALVPPPVFHYCGDDETFDIVFPDWSFWGWTEIKIKPWEILKSEIKESNEKLKWMDREPYAFWKGNTKLSKVRHDLVGCNSSTNGEWNIRIFDLDWQRERKGGFKTTDLTTQCTHRYKIYSEGHAWSVSQKYILACDSMTLIISPHYYDFYSRGLLPAIHYWPISENDLCNSINFAVKFGNKHTDQVREIGKAGSKFVQEQLKMKYVYDYMFHVLYQYAKLLKYQPTVPKGAVEVCSDTFICNTKGLRKKFRLSSKVDSPSDSGPCNLQHPYDHRTLEAFVRRKSNLTKKIEQWEESDISTRKKFNQHFSSASSSNAATFNNAELMHQKSAFVL
ncbi:OLC1v1039219C1 [Oldenlandia corymbosa var. corymbosa]|uniref:OLC1v1039219C1 n=1 Tax=Oldenlandia corymbosa var. corymbosa TaxID=529605 RepID=A0AAV1D1R8_OLDCO|nr:OLC1v1039219C1 [Oldenlandia corymbosa var. corymbosa]